MKKTLPLLFSSFFLLGCGGPLSPNAGAISSNPPASSSSNPTESSSPSSPTSSSIDYYRIDDEVTIYPRDMCALLEREPEPCASASYYLYHSENYPCVEFPKEACKNTDFDSLLPGDRVIVELSSESGPGVGLKDSFPAQYAFSAAAVVSESVEYALIIEVSLSDGEIRPVDGIDFSKLYTDDAIDEDGTYVPLESLSKAYATISAKEKGLARAIYTHNPRA